MKPCEELAVLLAQPERVDGIARERIPDLIGEVEKLGARLRAQLHSPESTPRREENGPQRGADRLLTAKEVGEILGVDKRWAYRNADKLPCTRRLTEGTVRFSEHGLWRWVESRR